MKLTFTIDLPPTLKKWVDEQLAEGQDPGEFLEELVRKEQKRRLRERIEESLHDALKSGPIRSDYQSIRREGRKQVRGTGS